MDKVRLNKSIIMAHNILRILRVCLVIGGVMIIIVAIAFPSLWRFVSVMIKSHAIDTAYTKELIAMGEYIVPYMYSVFIPAILGMVISFVCLKWGIGVLGGMREGRIFAEEYGPTLRRISKFMIIQVFAVFVLTIVLLFMFAPQAIEGSTTIVSLNLGGLIVAAFVSLASYLLDYGYSISLKSCEEPVNTISEYE